jgi:hypothetical protein
VPKWDQQRLTRQELDSRLKGTTLNIAIVLNQSDMIDAECDSEEAETNLRAMFGGKIPKTPTWQSKRGKHRLFRRPPDLPQKATLKLEGVEFRIGNGKGALSIVPPSVHPEGHQYRWLPGLSVHDVEPAELPATIVEKLRNDKPRQGSEPGETGELREGLRNTALFKLACKLAKASLTAEALEAALLAENVSRCKPPLPAGEVKRIAKSAQSRGSQSTQTNAEILLAIASEDSELWHTPDGVAQATIRQNGHREHWAIRSKYYKQWWSSP